MGKLVSCEECRKVYRNLDALEDLRENDGICLVCNHPIEVEDWDRVLASHDDDDFDDVPDEVDEDDFGDDLDDDLDDGLDEEFDDIEDDIDNDNEGSDDNEGDDDSIGDEDPDPLKHDKD